MPNPSYYTDAFKWARLILTGDAASTVPSDATLELLADDAVTGILLANPCIAVDDAFSPELLAIPKYEKAFAKALGIELTAFFVQTPAGNGFAGNIVSSEVTAQDSATVKRTRKEIDPQTAAAYARLAVRKTLLRFPCIKALATDSNLAGGFFGVNGYRRKREETPCHLLTEAEIAEYLLID